MIGSDDLTQDHEGPAFGASSEVVASSAIVQVVGPRLTAIADALERAS